MIGRRNRWISANLVQRRQRKIDVQGGVFHSLRHDRTCELLPARHERKSRLPLFGTMQPATVLAPFGRRGLEKYGPAVPVGIDQKGVHLVQADTLLRVFELPSQARHPFERPVRQAYQAVGRVFFEVRYLGGSAGG